MSRVQMVNVAAGASSLEAMEQAIQIAAMARAGTTAAKPPEGKATERVDVVRRGRQIVIPEGMNALQAAEALLRKSKEEDSVVGLHFAIDGYPLDGAVAFQRALDELFGWTEALKTPGFFKDHPPTMIGVQTGVAEKTQVIWGRLGVPKLSGYLQTGLDTEPPAFLIKGECRAGDRAEIEALVRRTEELLRSRSIYKGQAIRVSWEWEREGRNFDPIHNAPRFMDLRNVRPEELIFDELTRRQVEIGIFLPIERSDHCRRHQIPLRRGVLLEGPFGVGKTLAANVTALKATQNGWTFVYCQDIRDLHEALRFARNYAPAVLFAEDVDRVMEGDRDVEMDQILNVLDGVDTKDAEILTVLTTNAIGNITRALLRPGRIDTIVSMRPPGPQAAAKLIELYGRGLLADGIDLQRAGERLKGRIPASIRECVERAKMIATLRLDDGQIEGRVTLEDLLDAADMMQSHEEFLRQDQEQPTHVRKAAGRMVAGIGRAMVEAAEINGNGDGEHAASNGEGAF